jgi:hypothetical protein
MAAYPLVHRSAFGRWQSVQRHLQSWTVHRDRYPKEVLYAKVVNAPIEWSSQPSYPTTGPHNNSPTIPHIPIASCVVPKVRVWDGRHGSKWRRRDDMLPPRVAHMWSPYAAVAPEAHCRRLPQIPRAHRAYRPSAWVALVASAPPPDFGPFVPLPRVSKDATCPRQNRGSYRRRFCCIMSIGRLEVESRILWQP